MELNIQIEQIVADAVGAALSPEKIRPIIAANVEKAIKSSIDEAFGYSSPFKKMLDEKIRLSMPTDMEELGRYGDLVLKTVQAHINATQQEYIRNAIQPKLEKMLKALPSTMKLSELVKMLVDDLSRDSIEDLREGSIKPTIIVRQTKGVISGYWHLYIDPREEVLYHACRIQADFSNDGKCYSISINGEELQNKLLIGPMYNADALMLNIYTGGVVIELDQTDFSDVYYQGIEHDE